MPVRGYLNPELHIWCLVISLSLLDFVPVRGTAFKFVEYPYKETKKNEIIFHEFESACQQTNACSVKKGIERVQCVRECVSPACYSTIYKKDELEEGEIDVRLNSFKGCFIQRSRNRAR